jgi:nucleotide-binding universal stress UspA family protein
MFKTIVAAVDGSDGAYDAVRVAADMAVRNGARLVLLHVIEGGTLSPALRELARVEHLIEEEAAPRPDFSNFGNQAARAASAVGNERMAVEAQKRIRRALGKMILDNALDVARDAGKPDAEERTVDGEPAVAIAEFAAREGADIVAIASRGIEDAEAMPAGSVSHRVMQLCRCHCLAVR